MHCDVGCKSELRITLKLPFTVSWLKKDSFVATTSVHTFHFT